MATYKYSAMSRDGERVSGVVEGYSEFDAVERIKENCSIVLKLTEVKEEQPGLLNMEIGGPRLNAKAFTVMCSKFAIILKAGIPIARAVHLVAGKTDDKALRRVLVQVASDVEAGRSLSASFAERGNKLFPASFVESIRAGEESGSIDRSFESVYRHYDKQTKMNAKVKSALAYPAFVLLIAVVVVAVLMIFVVPKFIAMFEDYGAQLPLMTRILIGTSHFFQNHWMVLLAAGAVLVLAYKLYGNTETGRLQFARIGLSLPVFGAINQLNAASQFANTMATMLKSGLPMTKAVSITARVITNYYISQETGKLATLLEEGRALSSGMRDADCFPDILTDMVGVGEETGEMEETLTTVAGYYDTELEMAIASALRKLEPTVLVLIAFIAGFIVIAIYMAMISLYSAM